MNAGKERTHKSAEIDEDLLDLALRTGELVAEAKRQDRPFIVYISEMAFAEIQLSMNARERGILKTRMGPNKI